MSYGANPYILFLILVLLILGMDPEAGRKVEVIQTIMNKMTASMNNFKMGINAINNDFEEIHLLLRGLDTGGAKS